MASTAGSADWLRRMCEDKIAEIEAWGAATMGMATSGAGYPVSIGTGITFDLGGMIAMRMRWSSSHPFLAMTPVCDGDRVVVFILNKDQEPVILKDEWAMFPSDQFISALRLLEGK